MRDRRVRAGRRLRRALLHVLRGRRPRVAAVAARLPRALRARLARLPPPSRVDGAVRHVARAVPARAQRALHDLQELRRRQPRRRSCPPRSRSRSGAASRSAASTPTRSTSSAAAAPSGDRRRTASRSRPLASTYAVDAFVEQMPELARDARDDTGARAAGRQRDPPAVPAAVAAEHRRPGVHRRLRRGGRGVRRSTTVFDRAAQDRRRHRRHAHPAHGRPGDPRRGRSRARSAASTTSSSCRRSRPRLTHPDFEIRHGRPPRDWPSSRRGRTSSSSRATSCTSTRCCGTRRRSSSATSTTRSTSSSSSRRATSARQAAATSCCASTGVLNQQLTRGDFFLCASDKQRDFWLGQLAARRPAQPARPTTPDETLGKLITVVPFGVTDDAAVATTRR